MSTITLLTFAFFMLFVEGCRVELCQNAFRKGKCCTRGQGYFAHGCPGYKELQLVIIYGGCGIRWFEDRNFKGKFYQYTGPGKKIVRPRKKISSFIIHRCFVTLGQHYSTRTGKKCTKTFGKFPTTTYRAPRCPGNDDISLIMILGRCKVRLFEHTNFRGRSKTLRSPGVYRGRWDFKNEWVSSFKVLPL